MTLAARGDLRLRSALAENDSRIVRTMVNRAVLAAIGVALLLASAVLLAAVDRSPAVVGETSLFEILGFGGLLAGTVLVLRVVAAVARDDTTGARAPGSGTSETGARRRGQRSPCFASPIAW